MKTKIYRLIITFFIGLINFYLFLPPININAPTFWLFIFFIVIVYYATSILSIKELPNIIMKKFNKQNKKNYLFLIIPATILIIFMINLFNSPLFMANSYHNRININENGNFSEDIKEVDFNSLPLLDKDSSQKLGDRVMGQMPELVSQFTVSDLYTQINYNNDIIRVTPLEYADFIKWLSNRKSGVKGYITVNSVDGKSELVKLDKGMKYMPSAYFNENIYRHLRFKYPTVIFGSANFEIDNDGNPYWIIPTIKYEAIGLKEDVSGIIILNPITGESKKYKNEEIPTWVDHVYSADLIIEQVNDWGKYINGYFNSIFSQKNVVMTTEGYNYLALNDDIYLYTGITSIVKDESNIGFILTNLRTKETIFYKVPGAEEYSAMASALGQVQQMSYTSSFPLLINLNNRPTYLMSLKDNAGLVKMYAFVDVADYQKVTVTDASEGIKASALNYLNKYDSDNLIEEEITIDEISNVLIDGNTYYYIKANNQKYRVSIKVNETILPFVKNNDKLTIKYKDGDIKEIIKIGE